MFGMDEVLNGFAGIFIIFGGLFAQEVHAAVNTAVFEGVVFINTINYRLRLLCCSAIVEINQRFVIYLSAAVLENLFGCAWTLKFMVSDFNYPQ